ncbi:MAG: complex I subunit 1 family protein [Candidatus Bathyarchaeia archaeon]
MDAGWALFNLLIYPGLAFSSFAGLLFTWLQRKLTARFQWRVGPPVYQPFADLGKLLTKETIIPEEAVKPVFVAAPIISLSSVITAMLLIPMGLSETALSSSGDLLVVMYLLIMPSLALILGGAASGNPYGSLGSGRKVTLVIGYELVMAVALLSVAVGAGSLRLVEISLSRFGWLCPLSAASFFMVIFAKTGLPPFDQPEAKTEIMGGVLSEYSGSGLALFKLSHAVLRFALVSLMVTLFFPGPFSGPLGSRPWDVAWHLTKILIIFFFLSMVSALSPRLRIDQALRSCWKYLFTLALANLIFAVIYANLAR